jgi:ABC-2 type transport system permease protein
VAEPRAAGAIYDLGYQRYTGARLGRGHSIRALFAYSLRAAFGLSRGERAKSIPIVVVALVYLPAFGRIVAASMSGQAQFINYAAYLEFSGFLVALFAAAQAPELIVADKQHGTLSLYLSRPILGTDYVIAKLCALTAALLVITLLPLLILFLGKVAIAAVPATEFNNEKAKLLPILGGSLMMSLFVASLGLALSSFASRRAYGSAAVIVFFLMMPALVTMFRTVTTGDLRRYAILANPVFLSLGFTQWLFDIEARRRTAVGRADLPGELYLYVMLATSVVCIAWLLRRYRRDHA